MKKKDNPSDKIPDRFMIWKKYQGPILWRKLIKASLEAGATALLLHLALFMAQLPQPLRKYSLLVLALSLLIAFFSLRSFWFWLRSITFYNFLKFTIFLYIISVLVMAIATTGDDGFTRAVFRSSVQIPTIFITKLHNNVLPIFNYPWNFSQAYNSRNIAPSFDAISANELTTITLTVPNVTVSRKSLITPGVYIIMNNEANKTCKLDLLSDDVFFESQATLVTEGPKYESGTIWWRLRNETGSAWCPNEVLLIRP